MKRVAVFGKPGSGKSTLSKRLAATTGLPFHPLDAILYQPSGEQIDRETFDTLHQEILNQEHWIIDGFGPLGLFFQRLEQADTLVYIDLPYVTSYWLVTKRLLQSLIKKPEGWPEGSSVLSGTLNSYRTLKRCPQFWNDDFLAKLETISQNKRCVILRSVTDINQFLNKCRN